MAKIRSSLGPVTIQSTKQPYKTLKRKGTHTQPPTMKQLNIF